jgi:CRP/FNR family transcriptional regulator, cyclic AMP receptor protein
MMQGVHVGIVERLKAVPLFTNLSDKNLGRIAKLCKVREFGAGETIVHQGDEGVGLFVIDSGKVKIVKKTNEGREIEVATHGPGEFFGEFSVLDGSPRTASVVAVDRTTCFVVVSWDFRALMDSHPRIALQILPVLVTRFRETNRELLAATAH